MTRRLLRYTMALLASLLMLLFVSGCGGSGGSSTTLVAIAISPNQAVNLTAGDTLQLNATGTYSNGTTGDVTGSVQWSSKTPGVVTITAGGLVTALASVGQSTTISASTNGVSSENSIFLTVVAPGPNNLAEDWSTTGTPTGVAIASFGNYSGNVYITDSTNNLLRVYDAYGAPITSFSTTGEPHGVAIDSNNILYVTDISNNMLRKYSFNSSTSTWTQAVAWSTTGPPSGVAVDSSGNVYVTDSLNNLVRKYNTTGSAGTPPFWPTTGTPSGVAVDTSGNVYVTDYINNLVRKYNSDGTAGTPASWSTTGTPSGVAVDSSGNVYVTDFTAEIIRKYNSATGSQLATEALLWPRTGVLSYEPLGITLDTLGNVYVTDLTNNYIHKYLPLN